MYIHICIHTIFQYSYAITHISYISFVLIVVTLLILVCFRWFTALVLSPPVAVGYSQPRRHHGYQLTVLNNVAPSMRAIAACCADKLKFIQIYGNL